MRQELLARRRALIVIYNRYVEADASWRRARHLARACFPEASKPYRWTIGNPRSPVRHLFEQRQKALEQLSAARTKFFAAKKRAAQHNVTVLRLVRAP